MFIVHIIDYYDQRSVALIQNELRTKVDCLDGKNLSVSPGWLQISGILGLAIHDS